jgi:hypothetical protein
LSLTGTLPPRANAEARKQTFHRHRNVVRRGQRIGELEADIEEALVEAAIAQGEPVHRSASALPQAVLGVRIVERVSRVA